MKEIYDANEWWHNKAIEYITLKGRIDNNFAEWIKTQQMSNSISNGLGYTEVLLEVQGKVDDIPEFYKAKQ